MIQQAVFVRC